MRKGGGGEIGETLTRREMRRVNAVAPGPVNTEQFKWECKQNPDQYWLDAQATYVQPFAPSRIDSFLPHALQRIRLSDLTPPPTNPLLISTALAQPVPPMAVAKSILFLASEAWSGHITGQILNVDCGKQGKVIWMKQEAAASATPSNSTP